MTVGGSQTAAEACPGSRHALGGDHLWYKDAIIYELHVRAFFDSNGDGSGDFQGLTEKLDYLADLGITALWLLPFYPSPGLDDGYDIADYESVKSEYGTLRDVKVLIKEAHKRGLRVITELVCNHTSDQHPWFQRARRAPKGSPARDYYVWTDDPERYKDARIIFKDFERSNWTWDPIAEQYYWHRFYHHQPDLNFENPKVRDAIKKTLDFWFDIGVDGLRLDAIPYLYEREGTNCENLPETHEFLQGAAGAHRRELLGSDAAGRGEPVARGRRRLFRRRATSATCASTSRSCRGCSCRCAWRTASRCTTSSSRRRRFPTTRSGRSSCATTTS